MQSGAKAAIAGTIILVAAVGIRIGMIYHERNAPMTAAAQCHGDRRRSPMTISSF